MELLDLFIIFVVSLLACTYGASAGGSGLVVLPTLLFFGLSAQQSIATIFFGYSAFIIITAYAFNKAGKLDFTIAIPGALYMVCGAFIGSLIFLQLSEFTLQKMIAYVILAVLAVVVISPNFGVKKFTVSKQHQYLGYFLLFCLGVFGAIMPVGTSILSTYILIFCFGQTFIESAATRKIVLIGNNLLPTIIYAYNGIVVWDVGIAVLLGTSIGGYIGVVYAVKKGDRWVKWVFVPVVVVSAVKLLV